MKSKLDVVLDTSIFSGNRKRNSPAFRALTRLLTAGKVKLHLPYWVKNEFLSQQNDELLKGLRTVADGIDALRVVSNSKRLVKFSEQIQKDIKQLKNNVSNSNSKEFAEWLHQCNVAEYPMSATHGERVANAYFAGDPPFKTRKNRVDIPDGFVWQAVLDIANTYKPLHFVVKDKALLKAASKHSDVVGYDTLENFVATKHCQDALQELNNETAQANLSRAMAVVHQAEARLHSFTEDTLNTALSGVTVVSRFILSDTQEGEIEGVYEPEDIEFDFPGVIYYGSNEFGIPFESSVECDVSFFLFKSEYFTLSEHEVKQIGVSDWNEHFFLASRTLLVHVDAILVLEVDKDTIAEKILNTDSLVKLIQKAKHNITIVDTEIPDSAE